MPRCGRPALIALVVLAAILGAVSPTRAADNAALLFAEARTREATLRRVVDRRSNGASDEEALLERARTLVGAYEDISRIFPRHAVADDSLWQGANLAAYAFWQFGDATDRTLALRLFAAIPARFPTSPFTRSLAGETARLQAARATTRQPQEAPRSTPARPTPAQPASARPEPPASPAPSASLPPAPVNPAATAAMPPSGNPVRLTAIRREVLPGAVRVTLELDGEAAYRYEITADRSRFALRLVNAVPSPALLNISRRFTDDVVREIAIAPATDGHTRIDLRLTGAGDHSVYALYNPYRVVVDVSRRSVVAAAGPAPVTPPAAPRTSVPPTSSAPASVPSAAKNTRGGFSLSRQLGLGIGRLVIDPGHGGHDPGTMRGDTSEASLVLDIALRLEQLLAQRQPGIDVVLTRRTDAFVPLERRTAMAVKENADLFLSIHVNASEDTRARGIETYYLNFAPNAAAEAIAARENASTDRTMGQLGDIIKAITLGNKVDESRDFAAFVQSALVERLAKSRAVKNLGVKQAPFMVLVGATMPSALAEISFLTNDDDAAALSGAVYRQQVAEALYAGIVRYQKSLKSSPRVPLPQPVASVDRASVPTHD